MAREYGSAAPDDDSSKRIPDLLKKAAATGGALFLYAKLRREDTYEKVARDVANRLQNAHASSIFAQPMPRNAAEQALLAARNKASAELQVEAGKLSFLERVYNKFPSGDLARDIYDVSKKVDTHTTRLRAAQKLITDIKYEDPAITFLEAHIADHGGELFDVANMDATTTLKYIFGHSKIMDAIQYGGKHLKIPGIIDKVFGFAKLRETYGRGTSQFQDLGTIADNPALQTAGQRERFAKLESDYARYKRSLTNRIDRLAHMRRDIGRFNEQYVRRLVAQKWKLPFREYDELKGIVSHQEKIETLGREYSIGRINNQYYRNAIKTANAKLTRHTMQYEDVRRSGRLSVETKLVQVQKRLATVEARYAAAKGERLFFVAGDLLSVNVATGAVTKMEGKYNVYQTALRGRENWRDAFERGVKDLTGHSSDIDTLRQMSEAIEGGHVSQPGLGVNEPTGRFVKKNAWIHDRYYRASNNTWLGKLRRTMDIGLNERTDARPVGEQARAFIPETFKRYKQTFMGVFNPEDTSIDHRLLSNMTPRGIRRARFDFSTVWEMFFGGRKAKWASKFSGAPINGLTVQAYNFIARMNNGFARQPLVGWLALSGRSAATPAHFFGSVMFKRILPAFALFSYGSWLASSIRNYTGFDANRAATEQNYKNNLWWSGVKERLGINTFMRHVDELSGGALGFIAHPFFHRTVGLSPEEYKNQQETGYEEVRKGRWWSFGSGTPFRGERVQYFAPTALRHARAGDIYQSSTLWGSHSEQYANAALPTPDHPIAPLRHFLFDRYHYEKKHYRDRPYPLSAPLFEPTSPWGALLNPTLGRLIKPHIWMHENEMPYIMHGPHQGEPNPRFRGDARAIKQQIQDQADNTPYVGFVTPSGAIEPMAVIPVPGAPYAIDQLRKTRGEYHQRARERIAGQLNGGQIGSYGSGANAIAPYGSGSVKARKAIEHINKELKGKMYQPDYKRGARRFTGGALLEPILPPGLYKDQDPNNKRNLKRLISPYDLRYQGGLAYYSLTEMGGIYGFAATTLTGDLYANRPTIADAGSMTSFERTYWDRMNSGGMLPTPALSEVARRFLPHRYHTNTMYNPIRNTMPTWLPGPEGQDPGYFMDFLHGDPYTRVPNGEARLPGEAYERLHGIGRADLKMRGSQLGYDEAHMYQYLTGVREPFSPFLEDIMEEGHDIHSKVQRRWKREGILESAEQPIYDRKNDISGTMDAILKLQDGQRQVAEIKTLSDQRWQDIVERHNLDPKHTQQLNFYMHQTGIHSGKLVYIRRSDNKEVDVPFNYDQNMWNQTVAKLNDVRGRINSEIDAGYWGPGALYSDIDKLRILADVAPWSSQYKRYRDYLTHMDEAGISPEDRAQLREIKQQVSLRKDRYSFSPYRNSAIREKTVRVNEVISPGVFTTYEDPIHPVKLAGIKLNEDGMAYLDKFIRPGARVRIGVAADPALTISRDTMRTQRAVLFRHGTNMNRRLIQKGYATDTNENTPAGMHVHYTHTELVTGRFLEFVGHLPIPVIHNKFLPIDSPLELYRRTQVYGKDWQDWRHPFGDYLRPMFENWAQQGAPGVAFAGISTYLFLAGSPEARKVLPLVAMGITGALSLWRSADSNAVPNYRRKERDINEYFDVLKYLKYQGLYEGERKWIARHEHHDIGELLERYEAQGAYRKRTIQVLRARKRNLTRGPKERWHREEIAEINAKIKSLAAFREEIRLTRADALAIQYRNMAKTTLYGAEAGGDMRKIMLAMPAKDREFFQEFVKAPTSEHKAILRIVPDNQKRFLEAAWGMKVLKEDERPDLHTYFKHHFLPPRDWNGWSIQHNLDDYRLVVMKNEAMDMTAQGFWPQDEARVAAQGTRDIRPLRPTRAWHGENIRQQIEDIVTGAGLTDAEVELTPQQFGQSHVSAYITDGRRKDKKDRKEQMTGASRLF